MRRYMILAIAIISVFVGVCSAKAIYAYMVNTDKKDNAFEFVQNEIELVEDFEPPEELYPGVSFKKDVSVKNVDKAECYVRIKAVFTDSDMEQYCTVDWNNDDFIYNDEDGYYYYPESLCYGDSTPSLFTTVTLSDSIPEAEIKDFDILVYAESWQKGDSGTYEEAWAEYQKNKS